MMRIWVSSHDERISPRGSRLVDYRERMNKMRVYGVFVPSYVAIEQSSNGRALQIAIFTLGSFGWREEVKNGGFSDLLRFCDQIKIRLRIFSLMSFLRLSQNLIQNNFDENGFAAKSKFDLD